MNRSVDSSVSREELYELVWAEPMLKVAAKYRVSSSYMARVCTQLAVPRPERGYWAKLAVGKVQARPALPSPKPGDELVWNRDGQPRQVLRPRSALSTRLQSSGKASRFGPRPKQHPFLSGARDLIGAGRVSSYGQPHLRPAKRLLPDIIVTKDSLDRGLELANELFLSLEDKGHHVIIAPQGAMFHRNAIDAREVPIKNQHQSDLWSPARVTVVYIGEVAIGLTMVELTEEVEARYVNGTYVRLSEYTPMRGRRSGLDSGWTTKRTFPTGRFRLQAYSPYRGTAWARVWQESKGTTLISQMKTIRKVLEDAIVEIVKLIDQAAKAAELERQRWEAQQQKWRCEAQMKRDAQALKDSFLELDGLINAWATQRKYETFFDEISHQVGSLNIDDGRAIEARIRRARDLVGRSDALQSFMKWRSPDER